MNQNKFSKIGLIAFANRSGLGAQTRRLAKMIKPDRVLVVNSSYFSQNWQQNFDWYKDYKYFISEGFPSNDDVQKFLQGLTHVFTCENPYNFNLIYWAHKQGIKTYCQSNYEFCENLDKPYLPVPTKFLMPSYWKLEEMKQTFGNDVVEYLPPPIDPEEFKIARDLNFARTGSGKKIRLLHVIGTAASNDRNGTMDLMDAIKLCKTDFDLVVKTQHPVGINAFLDDPRVTYEMNDLAENVDLYKDFDALIIPRRYGGLCLTCNEGLMSGLPVIMTDISPNNILLPEPWLVKSKSGGKVKFRSEVEIFSTIPEELARKIDWLASCSSGVWDQMKSHAYRIATEKFSPEQLRTEYDKLWK